MVVEMIRRSLIGLGYSAILTFAVLTVMTVQDVQVPVSVIWKNTFGGMIMGIYFGCASLIFDMEEWSPLKKTIIHFLMSILIWLPLAFWLGWVPLQWTSILIGVGSFVVVYLLFWYGSYLYFKRIENEMNHSVKK